MNLQSMEKKYLQPKKEQIMADTNESKKAKALGQTLRLSFVSYNELLFLLFIFCADWLYLVLASQAAHFPPVSKSRGLNWPKF